MSAERAQTHLASLDLDDRIIRTESSSATVELAARALGTEPARIAKSLAFLVEDRPILVVAAGDARVDNRAFKEQFGVKARMIPGDQVEELVGHAIGGVCPFGVEPGVTVYLDESLRPFDEVYPAAGDDRSGVRLSLDELYGASGAVGWVAVTRQPGPAPA